MQPNSMGLCGPNSIPLLGQMGMSPMGPLGAMPMGPLGMGMAVNARRKNATRETTAMLKSWLQSHIKNPYPTKAEKIMLAILTKMSLTQV